MARQADAVQHQHQQSCKCSVFVADGICSSVPPCGVLVCVSVVLLAVFSRSCAIELCLYTDTELTQTLTHIYDCVGNAALGPVGLYRTERYTESLGPRVARMHSQYGHAKVTFQTTNPGVPYSPWARIPGPRCHRRSSVCCVTACGPARSDRPCHDVARAWIP